MAVFVETILPSGKGVRFEKLTTKKYRAVQARVAEKMGEGKGAIAFTMALTGEILLSSLRGITSMAIPPIYVKDEAGEDTKELDVDAMLDAVSAGAWMTLSYQELITEGPRSLDELLEPGDYDFAQKTANDATFPDRGRAGTLAGKTRTVSVES